MSEVSQAVLLVGGQGTRLRPLTNRRPKALVPLLNEPLLSYELRLLARHGIADIILAVGYKADALRTALGDGRAWGVRLTYVEDPLPLDTAGALGNVAHLLRSPFVAMNGDLVYDVDVSEVIRAHLRSGAAVTFCLRQVQDVARYGLIRCDASGWVTAFLEKQDRDETGRNTVNSGLYVMDPEVLDFIPRGRAVSNETELFPALLKAGKRLLGFLPQQAGYWADVGTIESYLSVSRDLLDGAVPWVVPSTGRSLTLAADVSLIPPVHIGERVTLDAGVRLGPHVTVGDGCHVGAGCRINDAILWENVTLGPHCHLQHCIIGDNVHLPADTHRDEGVVVT